MCPQIVVTARFEAVEESADQPAEAVTEAPAEQPAEDETEAPVEQPAEDDDAQSLPLNRQLRCLGKALGSRLSPPINQYLYAIEQLRKK